MGEEEEAAVEPDPAVAETPPKGNSKLLIIIVALVLALGVGGGAAYFFLIMPKAAEDGGKAGNSGKGGAPEEEEVDIASLGTVTELPSFIVNLSGGTGRYLKVTIVLKLSAERVTEEIKNREPQIKDAVITVLSSKSPEEILSVQGKYDLKGEIIKRINTFLATGVVKELFFVEFVVQ